MGLNHAFTKVQQVTLLLLVGINFKLKVSKVNMVKTFATREIFPTSSFASAKSAKSSQFNGLLQCHGTECKLFLDIIMPYHLSTLY